MGIPAINRVFPNDTIYAESAERQSQRIPITTRYQPKTESNPSEWVRDVDIWTNQIRSTNNHTQLCAYNFLWTFRFFFLLFTQMVFSLWFNSHVCSPSIQTMNHTVCVCVSVWMHDFNLYRENHMRFMKCTWQLPPHPPFAHSPIRHWPLRFYWKLYWCRSRGTIHIWAKRTRNV